MIKAARKKIILKSHLGITILASATQRLGSICESEGKRKKERKERMKGRKWDPVFKDKTRNDFVQSRGFQRGKVFMRMKQSAKPHSSSTQDWSQEQSQNFVSQDQTLLMKKYVPELILGKSRHILYAMQALSFWQIYLELENCAVRN